MNEQIGKLKGVFVQEPKGKHEWTWMGKLKREMETLKNIPCKLLSWKI